MARGLAAGLLLLAAAATAYANDANKTLKIGVIYDLTGPFAGGGSELHYLGAKTMIDWFIQKGPIEGYKIEAVYIDGQSKPDVVINEATRLLEQEKVDMLLGFYSSAEWCRRGASNSSRSSCGSPPALPRRCWPTVT
jgi:branched-chain amino acid transport system substrate-binding protein